MKNKGLKILTVGNSFGVDTSQHVADIALSLGFERVKIGVLYIGGCSINKHYANAANDLPAYRYYENTGLGWSEVEGKRISETVMADDWDFISIQHGTADGSRYTLPASYVNLTALVSYIKGIAPPSAKIAFNMAWVMEPYGKHPEIRAYNGDQLQMYQNLVQITEQIVLPTKDLDIVSPTGTAIQNGRATEIGDALSRDGFHLSLGKGRYIAGLTFLKALTGIEIDNVPWVPEGVTEREKEIAVQCANLAISCPFAISPIKDRE